MLLLWATSVSAAPGFAVIAFGSADAKATSAWFEQHKSELPRHADFPKIVDSAKVGGMNPGFSIVLVATPSAKKVADAVGKALREDLEVAGAYVRPIDDPSVEDARLVVVEKIDDLIFGSVDYPEVVLAQPESTTNVRARAKPLGAKAVLVFTLDADVKPNLELWFQAPQTACTTAKLKPLEKAVTRFKTIKTSCRQGD